MKPLALVVENDAGTRKLLDTLLTRAAMETDIVSGGREAVQLLRHVDYSAILLDLILDGVTGFEILAFLQHNRPHLLARTIVLSSAGERQLEEVRVNFEGVQVIRKPFDITDLLAAVSARAEGATRVGDLAEEYCRRSIAAGATAGIILSVESNGTASPTTHFGYPPGLVESFGPLPIDAQYPICAAIRNAKPVWIASINLATAEYPLLAPLWQSGASKALAAIPLVRDGVVIGGAGWSFQYPRLFAERERETFLAIAEAVAGRLEVPSQSAQHAHA